MKRLARILFSKIHAITSQADNHSQTSTNKNTLFVDKRQIDNVTHPPPLVHNHIFNCREEREHSTYNTLTPTGVLTFEISSLAEKLEEFKK